jgi:hypothetical protein
MSSKTFAQWSLNPRGGNASEDKGFYSFNNCVALFLIHNIWEQVTVAEPPELFQLKCPSLALKARLHLNRNKPSVPRI